MEVRGIHYAWAPINGFICVSLHLHILDINTSLKAIKNPQLYSTQTSAPKVLARVARTPNMVLLEITQEAIRLSLLEPCLVATVLFVCGHNID